MTPSPQKLTAEGWSEKLFPVNPLRPEVGFDLRKDVAAAIQQAMDQARQEGFESGLAKQFEIQQIRERQARDEGYARGCADTREGEGP